MVQQKPALFENGKKMFHNSNFGKYSPCILYTGGYFLKTKKQMRKHLQFIIHELKQSKL